MWKDKGAVVACRSREDKGTEALWQFAAFSSGAGREAGRGDYGISETVGCNSLCALCIAANVRLKRTQVVTHHLQPNKALLGYQSPPFPQGPTACTPLFSSPTFQPAYLRALMDARVQLLLKHLLDGLQRWEGPGGFTGNREVAEATGCSQVSAQLAPTSLHRAAQAHAHTRAALRLLPPQLTARSTGGMGDESLSQLSHDTAHEGQLESGIQLCLAIACARCSSAEDGSRVLAEDFGKEETNFFRFFSSCDTGRPGTGTCGLQRDSFSVSQLYPTGCSFVKVLLCELGTAAVVRSRQGLSWKEHTGSAGQKEGDAGSSAAMPSPSTVNCGY